MKANGKAEILTDKPFLHQNSWVTLGGGSIHINMCIKVVDK